MEKKYKTLLQIIYLFVASFLILLIDRWQTGSWRTPAIVLVSIIVIIAILYLLLCQYRKAFNKLGVKKYHLGTAVRLFAVSILATLFTIYILHPNPTVTLPPSLQFNVIIISATLGGLVLAGASNRRISRRTHNKFMSVAKNLIYATLLFLVFTALLFWIESTGGINVNESDFSRAGIIRGIFFYGGAISFYAGIFLFSWSLIDLALTLRDIRRPRQGVGR